MSAPDSPQTTRSLFERARVVRDVLGVAELERVHEDAHDHQVAFGTSPIDQRRVPVVQRAHGGNQADHPTGSPGLVQHGTTGGDRLDDLHRDL